MRKKLDENNVEKKVIPIIRNDRFVDYHIMKLDCKAVYDLETYSIKPIMS